MPLTRFEPWNSGFGHDHSTNLVTALIIVKSLKPCKWCLDDELQVAKSYRIGRRAFITYIFHFKSFLTQSEANHLKLSHPISLLVSLNLRTFFFGTFQHHRCRSLTKWPKWGWMAQLQCDQIARLFFKNIWLLRTVKICLIAKRRFKILPQIQN